MPLAIQRHYDLLRLRYDARDPAEVLSMPQAYRRSTSHYRHDPL